MSELEQLNEKLTHYYRNANKTQKLLSLRLQIGLVVFSLCGMFWWLWGGILLKGFSMSAPIFLAAAFVVYFFWCLQTLLRLQGYCHRALEIFQHAKASGYFLVPHDGGDLCCNLIFVSKEKIDGIDWNERLAYVVHSREPLALLKVMNGEPLTD